MLVIGIAGKKRSGKDTVASILVQYAEQSGIKATKRALADALKEECAEMLTLELGDRSYPLSSDYEKILAEMYNDDTKEKYRLLLQWWGTEFKRNMVSDTYWVDELKEWIKNNNNTKMIVIPDIRFPNELRMVKELDGVIIKVSRPETDIIADNHPSEIALDDFHAWDFVIPNDTDLDDLQQRVAGMFFMISDWAWGHSK